MQLFFETMFLQTQHGSRAANPFHDIAPFRAGMSAIMMSRCAKICIGVPESTRCIVAPAVPISVPSGLNNNLIIIVWSNAVIPPWTAWASSERMQVMTTRGCRLPTQHQTGRSSNTSSQPSDCRRLISTGWLGSPRQYT